MAVGGGRDVESLEELEARRSKELVHEERGDAALDRLIEEVADRQHPERDPEPHEPREDEFVCRGCHLIFSRSCLADDARVLCRDCAAEAAAGDLPGREVPHAHRVHHPCPACGSPVMVPEREEVSCGFVCPSCRVHLSVRGGHLHLVWSHHQAIIEGVEP